MDDFLGIPRDRYVADNALCFAIRDGFPVSEGHTLVIPRRKVPDWFPATWEEQVAILDLRKSTSAKLPGQHTRPALTM